MDRRTAAGSGAAAKGVGAALAVTLALALAGCGGGASGGTSARLTVGMQGAPLSLAANTTVTGGRTMYYQAVYDTLVLLRPDGTPAPMLATKWAYNPEQTVLTLTLRGGVKFTNGAPFDASAAKANLERNVKVGFNAQAMSAVKSFAAPDAATLVITLKQKDPGIVRALGTSISYMQAPNTFDKPDAATRPVGTGPYTVASDTVIGSNYVYKKNPGYWNAGAVRYNELALKSFTDQSAMANAIRSGQVNAAHMYTSLNKQVRAAGWSVATQKLDVAGLFLFDREGKVSPALKDRRVRQAINLAVNREALLRVVSGGMGTTTAQMFSTDSGPLDPALETRWAYDPAKARALLKEAGHATDVKITMPTTAAGKVLMDVVKQQLGAVGVTVDLKDGGPNVTSDILAAKYPASYFPFQGGDPWFMMQQLLAPQAPLNPFRVRDARMLGLIDRYRAGDATAQRAALKELNAHLTEQAWFAPWLHVEMPWATDTRTSVRLVKNYTSPYVLNFTPKA
ncbi:ABC transporter substrate-binding protein [Spirillospora sp. CA-294931]|uniref:ABC transporter substrate-binding protein n=1 Tax=Spirillospora sp. CA-294931 TaxID=3240042 RepID=UPI003D90B020